MEIRQANLSDAAEISELIKSFTHYFVVESTALEKFSEQGIAEFIHSEKVEYFVAEVKPHFNQLVSQKIMAVIAYIKPAHLLHFFVAEAFQGKGNGRLLWNHVEALLIQTGQPKVTVNASLNAVPIYEKLGFIAGVQGIEQMNGMRFKSMTKQLNGQQ